VIIIQKCNSSNEQKQKIHAKQQNRKILWQRSSTIHRRTLNFYTTHINMITFLGQTKPPAYWRWTVPLNNAQMGLGVLGELQMAEQRSKRPITY